MAEISFKIQQIENIDLVPIKWQFQYLKKFMPIEIFTWKEMCRFCHSNETHSKYVIFLNHTLNVHIQIEPFCEYFS